MNLRVWQWRQKWGQWFAALLLHGILLIGLAFMPKPDPGRLADADNQPKPVSVVWVSPSPTAEPEPEPELVEAPTSKPKVALKNKLEVEPSQQAQQELETTESVTPIPEPVPETNSSNPTAQNEPSEDQPEQSNRRRAASALLLPSPSTQRPLYQNIPHQPPHGNILTFLQTVQCGDMERQEPQCRAYRRQLADVHLAYGRAVMREGAAIGAEYRLMNEAELATAFGLDPWYDGPAETLHDSSMDPLTSSSDEIRERLGHWPPDPIFGD